MLMNDGQTSNTNGSCIRSRLWYVPSSRSFDDHSLELALITQIMNKLTTDRTQSLYERKKGRLMRIAQVAPLWESVPPKLYGGTERIVSYITEELVAQGHDVTLFASGDSETAARLEAICPQALRLNTGIFNRDAPMMMLAGTGPWSGEGL